MSRGGGGDRKRPGVPPPIPILSPLHTGWNLGEGYVLSGNEGILWLWRQFLVLEVSPFSFFIYFSRQAIFGMGFIGMGKRDPTGTLSWGLSKRRGGILLF